jgi:hypothetical protein
MKNLVNFLKTKSGLLLLTLTAAVVAVYYFTDDESSKVESASTSTAVEATIETAVVPAAAPDNSAASSSSDNANSASPSAIPSVGTIRAEPAPAVGESDESNTGSADSPSEPSDGEEIIIPVDPASNVVPKVDKPAASESGTTSMLQRRDPTSYFQPEISHVERAEWAETNRSAPRCDNFRYQTQNAVLVTVN